MLFPGDYRAGERVDVELSELPDELKVLDGVKPHKRFKWFIISGASSAGKDVLTEMILFNLSTSYNLEVGKKYTTRDRRPGESANVEALSEQEFDLFEKQKKILFPYTKRHHRYGLNAEQHRRNISAGIPMVTILTHLEIVPTVVGMLNNKGIKTFPIFIEVPKKHLNRRVKFRNLEATDVAERIKSIDQDLNDIKRRKNFRSEYKIIKNGDNRAFDDVANELVNYCKTTLNMK